MFELRWLHNIPSQSLEGAVQYVNDLGWRLTTERSGNEWLLFSGDSVVLKSSSREELDAFLYGLALAYSVMPEKLLLEFKAENKSEQR